MDNVLGRLVRKGVWRDATQTTAAALEAPLEALLNSEEAAAR